MYTEPFCVAYSAHEKLNAPRWLTLKQAVGYRNVTAFRPNSYNGDPYCNSNAPVQPLSFYYIVLLKTVNWAALKV